MNPKHPLQFSFGVNCTYSHFPHSIHPAISGLFDWLEFSFLRLLVNLGTDAPLVNELDCEILQVPLFENVIPDSKNYGLYILPGFTKSEGFYCCVLQKKEKVNLNSKIKLENLSILKSIDHISSFTKNSSNSVFWNENETIYGSTELTFNFYRQHLKKLKWMKTGVKIGEISKKGFTPDIELALNPNLINDENSIELTKQQALKYLHGDTFELQAPVGIHLVSYQNKPLGFIKHLGNRFNNLYPKEWRIRMDLGF